jgi:hypothetical protein
MVIPKSNSRRLLLFPTGNRNQGSVSIFLENFESAQKDESDKFHVCAQFAIALLHATDDTVYKSQGMNNYFIKGAQHRFTPSCTDWGFSSFIKYNDLNVPIEGYSKPLLEKDQLRIGVQVNVVHDETGYLWHSFEK